MLGRMNLQRRSVTTTPSSQSRNTPKQFNRTPAPVYIDEVQPRRFMVQSVKLQGQGSGGERSQCRRLNSNVTEPRVEVEQVQRQVFERRQRLSYPVRGEGSRRTSTGIPIPVGFGSTGRRITPSIRSDIQRTNDEEVERLNEEDSYEEFIQDITPPSIYHDTSGVIPNRRESRARLRSRINSLLSEVNPPDQEGKECGNAPDFASDPLDENGNSYDEYADDEFSEFPSFKSPRIPSVVDSRYIECPPRKIMPLKLGTQTRKSKDYSTISSESGFRSSDIEGPGIGPRNDYPTIEEGAPRKNFPLRKHTPSAEKGMGREKKKYDLSSEERFKRYLERIQGITTTTKKPNLAVRKLPFSSKQDDDDDFTDISPINYDEHDLAGPVEPSEIPFGTKFQPPDIPPDEEFPPSNRRLRPKDVSPEEFFEGLLEPPRKTVTLDDIGLGKSRTGRDYSPSEHSAFETDDFDNLQNNDVRSENFGIPTGLEEVSPSESSIRPTEESYEDLESQIEPPEPPSLYDFDNPQDDDVYPDDRTNVGIPMELKNAPPSERLIRPTEGSSKDFESQIQPPPLHNEELEGFTRPVETTPKGIQRLPENFPSRPAHNATEIRQSLKRIINSLLIVYGQLEDLDSYYGILEREIMKLRRRLTQQLPDKI